MEDKLVHGKKKKGNIIQFNRELLNLSGNKKYIIPEMNLCLNSKMTLKKQ